MEEINAIGGCQFIVGWNSKRSEAIFEDKIVNATKRKRHKWGLLYKKWDETIITLYFFRKKKDRFGKIVI